MNTTNSRYDKALKELQENSVAYNAWQEALAVRDAIILDDGNGTIEFERIKEIIKYWHGVYDEEWKNLKVSMNNSLTVRVNDLYDEMVIHQSMNKEEQS